MKKIIFLIPMLLGLFLVTSCEDCTFDGVRNSALPDATNGNYYTQYIDLDCSCDPKQKTVSFVSGSLPPGLSINGEGTISGTPNATGTYNFTLKIEVCFSKNYNDNTYFDCEEKTEGFSITVN